MEQTIINFIREIGVDNAIRLLWVIVVAVIALSVLLALRIVYLYAKRGNPAQDTLTRAFERQQKQLEELAEDATEGTQERWKLIAERFQAEERLRHCQEKLAQRGITSMTLADEQALRNMVVRQQTEIREKDKRIAELEKRG